MNIVEALGLLEEKGDIPFIIPSRRKIAFKSKSALDQQTILLPRTIELIHFYHYQSLDILESDKGSILQRAKKDCFDKAPVEIIAGNLYILYFKSATKGESKIELMLKELFVH
ncbi:hypothetical protein [Paenibacillus methanolicus]|uniref:Uncharacterized protein n=1 Tax=Paenibacillus methanolicus TaxID=582686 RepID=A0A5S5BYH1_9BACL|nr:hypothetical protein [Paenibacillus methanolicus]TYP71989.1 hypothetical protein BCM02_109268 [Paenibacillus methanolicus]